MTISHTINNYLCELYLCQKEEYECKSVSTNFPNTLFLFSLGHFCTKTYTTKFYRPINVLCCGSNIKYLVSYCKKKYISSLSHTRKQLTCVEDTGKLTACWLLLPLGCITVAGFCTVTVESGDEDKFVEVRDLLMITLPTTSYNV